MPLLSPASIAVIGASQTAGSVGHDVLSNLLTQGYKGAVFPVNPKHQEILGKQCYASVKDVKDPVDLAIIIVPAKVVPVVLKECGEKKVPNAIVISAGFAEVHTDEGKKLEEELVSIARQYKITLVGPNCLGILRPSLKLNASFAKELPPEGNVALISQSGATAVALMDQSPALHLGYSLVLSIGNKATMDECDYLELCEKDDETKVIGMYLESINDGQRFIKTAARIGTKKPIVLLKSGVSERGRRAASSHTGALAGNDAAINAACTQAGIRRAHSYDEFLDLLRVLSAQPELQSRNIAIVTNAGGPGILATDAVVSYTLELAALEAKTTAALQKMLSPAAAIGNPIDVVGDADAVRYQAALEACALDANVDGIVALLTPQVMTPCTDIAKAIVDVAKKNNLLPVVTSFIGGESVREAIEVLEAGGVPNFESPERAVAALAALLPVDENVRVKKQAEVSTERATRAAALLQGKRGLLDEAAVQQLFALYELVLPPADVAHSADEAVQLSEAIGYPVIAKVSSPTIIHKTDVGGVKANLKSSSEVRAAYEVIVSATQVNDVLIQKFLPIGNEFIVGAIRDPSFGPLVMVGLGGIYTELFKDTCFRIAPVTEEESYEMLQSLTAWKLLLGMRNKNQLDIAGLAAVVQRISEMVTECPQIRELDINPILVGETEVVIADAKVITNQ